LSLTLDDDFAERKTFILKAMQIVKLTVAVPEI